MQPQISYVTSADGTRIAMTTYGEGRPLVMGAATWLSSIQCDWQIPTVRANLERLSANRMVVQYDARGAGMSQRDVTDFSLEARINDFAAVIDGTGASSVDILGSGNTGPMVISYAVRHADRVGRLVLGPGGARSRDYIMAPKRWALQPLIEVDWELYLQTLALVDFGWTELGRQISEVYKDVTKPEALLAAWRDARDDDVWALLPEIRCPTLVLRSDDPRQGLPLEASQELVARIPNARFAMITTPAMFLLAHNSTEYVDAINSFLDANRAAERATLPSGTAIILFLDIADSTALTERMGDTAFREAARALDERLRVAIRDNGGTAIEGKVLGDGVMAVFSSAREAIEAALVCNSESRDLPLHLGIHAGDVVRETNNVYGGAVNVASRVCGLSAPGELLVSETVRSLARTSSDVQFEDRGEHELKGVAERVRVWSVSR